MKDPHIELSDAMTLMEELGVAINPFGLSRAAIASGPFHEIRVTFFDCPMYDISIPGASLAS
jgi:hypothetical protein